MAMLSPDHSARNSSAATWAHPQRRSRTTRQSWASEAAARWNRDGDTS